MFGLIGAFKHQIVLSNFSLIGSVASAEQKIWGELSTVELVRVIDWEHGDLTDPCVVLDEGEPDTSAMLDFCKGYTHWLALE